MFTYIYDWMKNIAFYMILMTAVLQVLPGNSYQKYVRFFTGLILVVLLITPVLKIFGAERTLGELYDSAEYRQELREIEQQTESLKEMEERYLEREEGDQGENF